MKTFFKNLSTLRKGEEVTESVVDAAKDDCVGGVFISDIKAFALHLEEEYPCLGFFDASITAPGADGFPAKLAAFIVSATGTWTKENQHAVFAVYGWHIIQMLEASRDTLSKERYRDQLAGALQHYANGIWPACRHLGPDGYLNLPFRSEPWSCAEASMEAVRLQMRATTLRSEKYAAPGTSRSHVDSYRGALEALAYALETFRDCNASCAPAESDAMIERLRRQAKTLLLHSNTSLQQKLSIGGDVPEAQKTQIHRERRIPTVVKSLLPPSPDAALALGGTTATKHCVNCGEGTLATHKGYICRCLCLCATCAPDATLLECPLCKEYTEFVRA